MNYATLAFEHSPAPMVVLSYRFIKECNAAFADLFGYQQGELLNCSMRKLFPSTPKILRKSAMMRCRV